MVEVVEGIASLSGAFSAMADRISHNPDSSFGGAWVIVGPDGEVKHSLMLDNAQSGVMFWSTLRTVTELALAELGEKARGSQGNGWSGRR